MEMINRRQLLSSAVGVGFPSELIKSPLAEDVQRYADRLAGIMEKELGGTWGVSIDYLARFILIQAIEDLNAP